MNRRVFNSKYAYLHFHAPFSNLADFTLVRAVRLAAIFSGKHASVLQRSQFVEGSHLGVCKDEPFLQIYRRLQSCIDVLVKASQSWRELYVP